MSWNREAWANSNSETGKWPQMLKSNRDEGRAIGALVARLGDQGWELVAATPSTGAGSWAALYFKRPKA